MWESYKKGYKAYLYLEKSMSENSVSAYLMDLDKFTSFLEDSGNLKTPGEIELSDLQKFLKWVSGFGLTESTQARMVSGMRSFFKYCLVENIVRADPSLLVEAPKLKRTLPDILSFDEIEQIIGQIDLSKPEGGRNRAILETLYS